MTSQAMTVSINSTGYGAIELKKIYQKFLMGGLICALVVHFVIIGSYKGVPYIINQIFSIWKDEELIKQQTQPRIINLSDLEPPPSATEDETPPPKPLEQIQSAPPKDLQAMTPQPVAKEKAEEQTIKTQEELENIKTPVSNFGDSGKFTYTGTPKVEEKKVEEKIEKKEKEVVKETYTVSEVEIPPECLNLDQVKAQMHYPENAREMGIEGKVTVRVLVGTDGTVIKIGNVTGKEAFYDEVSSKARNLIFKPGIQNGKAVKVWVLVPFNFKLN